MYNTLPQNYKINQSPSRPDLKGSHFVNRFDLLMRLQERSKQELNINLNRVLDPAYLQSNIFFKKPDLVQTIFRSLISNKNTILDLETLKISSEIEYFTQPNCFLADVKLILTNHSALPVLVSNIKLKFQDFLTVKGDLEMQDYLQIQGLKEEIISFRISVKKTDLLRFNPPVLSLFAFSQNEMAKIRQGKKTDLDLFRHVICVPLNITRFLNYVEGPDFSVLGSLQMVDQCLLVNHSIDLEVLSNLFPHLSNIYEIAKLN